MYKVVVIGVFVHPALAGWVQAVMQEGSEQDIPQAYAPDRFANFDLLALGFLGE